MLLLIHLVRSISVCLWIRSYFWFRASSSFLSPRLPLWILIFQFQSLAFSLFLIQNSLYAITTTIV